MKLFISSVIAGFEHFRDAAAAAVQSLGHDVIRAEDFSAVPATPQVACLAGVRQADAVILVLGSKYGVLQPSGKSATHEEFEEAKDRKPMFVFVQSGVSPEPRQSDLISEAQAWSTGVYTALFSDSDSLRIAITTAIHRWLLANASGKVDAQEMLNRALTALPEERRGISTGAGPHLAISVVGAPRQSILRPAQLEAASFQRELKQRVLFGEPNIFSTSDGIQESIEEHALVLSQRDASLRINEEGAIRMILRLSETGGGLSAIIQEDVQDTLLRGVQFASQLLDSIDNVERLSHVAIAASLINCGHSGWRTRREHEANPTSMRVSRITDDSPIVVTLSPPHRSRGAMRHQAQTIAEDITVLLRRLLQK